VGPDPFFDFFKIFKHPNLIFELVTFLMSKFHQILQVDILEHRLQLYFLDQLQNPKGLQVINSGINSKFNLP
jgi:hypothetical protein